MAPLFFIKIIKTEAIHRILLCTPEIYWIDITTNSKLPEDYQMEKETWGRINTTPDKILWCKQNLIKMLLKKKVNNCFESWMPTLNLEFYLYFFNSFCIQKFSLQLPNIKKELIHHKTKHLRYFKRFWQGSVTGSQGVT